jgi:protein-disulfide isomerase
LAETGPATEGTGYPDSFLKALAVGSGISNTDRFNQCIDDGDYFEWVANADNYAFSVGVEGTPTIWLNGKPLPDSAFASTETFLAAIRGQ